MAEAAGGSAQDVRSHCVDLGIDRQGPLSKDNRTIPRNREAASHVA
jgi:hypothetical protein